LHVVTLVFLQLVYVHAPFTNFRLLRDPWNQDDQLWITFRILFF